MRRAEVVLRLWSTSHTSQDFQVCASEDSGQQGYSVSGVADRLVRSARSAEWAGALQGLSQRNGSLLDADGAWGDLSMT